MPPGVALAGGGGGGGGGAGGDSGRGKKGKGKKTPTIRKACDFCNERKKKCDGNGIDRCTYCKEKNHHNECVYSLRKPQRRARKPVQGPAMPPAPRRSRPSPPSAAASDQAPSDGAEEEQEQEQESSQSASTAVALESYHQQHCGPIVPLKRARMAPSTATGLVGMIEDHNLHAFFRCMGFLPLTCQSDIRAVMVRILVDRKSRSQVHLLGAGHDHNSGSGSGSDTERTRMVTSGGEGEGGGTRSMSAKESDPSACMFWCAVALGGLARGAPIESMARYVELAGNAVSGNVAPPAMSRVARAWALMAYMYGFCQDSDKYRICQSRAQFFFDTSFDETRNMSDKEKEERAEFELLIRHIDGLGLFYGDGPVKWRHVNEYLSYKSESNNHGQQSARHPPMPHHATIMTLRLFIMLSYRRFGQAFFTDVWRHRTQTAANGACAAYGGGAGGAGIHHGVAETDAATAPAAAAAAAAAAFLPLASILERINDDDDDDDEEEKEMEEGDDRLATERNALLTDAFGGGHGDVVPGWADGLSGVGIYASPDPEFVLSGERAEEPPAHGSRNMTRMMASAVPEYERLNGILDGLDVCSGIGGLMISCTSVVLHASQGDWPGSVEHMRRCVKILRDFPGLMRFPMGLHMTHLLIAMIAGAQRHSLDTQPLYTQLREAYNPMKPRESKEIPPAEEWDGIDECCSHVYCRAIDGRFGRRAEEAPVPMPMPMPTPTPISSSRAGIASEVQAAWKKPNDGRCYDSSSGSQLQYQQQHRSQPVEGMPVPCRATGGEGRRYISRVSTHPQPGPAPPAEQQEQKPAPYAEGLNSQPGGCGSISQREEGRASAMASATWLNNPEYGFPSTFSGEGGGDDTSSCDDHDGNTMSQELDPVITAWDMGCLTPVPEPAPLEAMFPPAVNAMFPATVNVASAAAAAAAASSSLSSPPLPGFVFGSLPQVQQQ
ncbi:unnamed protein product, partial [Pylaiella littoralis]